MPSKSWLKIISRLKALIVAVGPIWPKSTKLAGYAEEGPYRCGNCEYLKGAKAGKVFKDADGKGRCSQPVMVSDPEVKKDEQGRPVVNIERGCCEFVEPLEALVQIKK